jgi:hypothetical protein
MEIKNITKTHLSRDNIERGSKVNTFKKGRGA